MDLLTRPRLSIATLLALILVAHTSFLIYSPAHFLESPSNGDNPNWHYAINWPLKDEYWELSEQISKLEGIGALDVVEHKDNMNVINWTSASNASYFQMKQWKIKSKFLCLLWQSAVRRVWCPWDLCLCCPVDHWCLSCESPKSKVNAKSCHCCLFCATLGEDEKVYVNKSLGFKQHGSNSFEEKHFMVWLKVLVPSENISLRSLATMAYLKLVLILHICWQERHFHLL